MVDNSINEPEPVVQPQSLKNLFERARAAHKSGELPQARNLYNQIFQRSQKEEHDQDMVEQARAFNALLDRDLQPHPMGPLSTFLAMFVGLGIWIYVGLGIAAIFSDWTRNWWSEHWSKLLLGSAAVIVLLMVSLWAEKKLAVQSEGRRRVVVAFIIVPFIALTMMTALAFGAGRLALVMEIVLILVGSLMPAAVYYLFLATRRPSILNEFLGNLSRLGLLLPKPVQRSFSTDQETAKNPIYESHEERRARIESYFQRFEAIYGVLRFETEDLSPLNRTEFVNRLIMSIDSSGSDYQMPKANVQVSDIFRANLIIPLGLVTILSTLGWLLVMQPDLKAVIYMPVEAAVKRVDPQAESAVPQHAASSGFRTESSQSPGKEEDGSKPNAQEKPPELEEPLAPEDAPAASKTRTNVLIAHLTPTWTPVTFAFLGAYFFGIQMLFRRFVRRDLGPNAYLAFSNRIIIAVIGIWVAIAAYIFLVELVKGTPNPLVGSIMFASNDNPGYWPLEILILAFVIGVFPRTLWQFIGAAFSKMNFVKAVIPTIEAKQPLSELDGLTIWHESRLEEEDVENVPNMATVDLVDIMLHTQIPAERLISWIDQAILYSILGPKGADNAEGSPRNKLRAIGLRSASQVVAAFNGDTHQKKALFSALGQDSVHAMVLGIKLEGNYDRVSSWRCVAE